MRHDLRILYSPPTSYYRSLRVVAARRVTSAPACHHPIRPKLIESTRFPSLRTARCIGGRIGVRGLAREFRNGKTGVRSHLLYQGKKHRTFRSRTAKTLCGLCGVGGPSFSNNRTNALRTPLREPLSPSLYSPGLVVDREDSDDVPCHLEPGSG